jgi:hypothetical protein
MSLNKYACKRAYIPNDKIIVFLERETKFVGKARFTDHVLKYKTEKGMDTDKDLLWVREIHENVWPTMKVGMFYPFYKKDIKFESGFQFFTMPIGNPAKGFNKLADAIKAFDEDLEVWFSFHRATGEYLFEDISIYVENVQFTGMSIECVCRKESNTLQKNMQIVDQFMNEHDIKRVISRQVATLVRMKLRK